jgi:hypothetical protein
MAFEHQPSDKMTCPATMHADKCSEHYMNCPKWINVQGQHPQTGAVVNQWDCADTWSTVLMIENSQQQRGTQAAIESFRNEMTKDNRAVLELASNNRISN